MKRTIKNLLNDGCRTYVFLPNKTLAKQFLQDAESEGFTFCDGVKPTSRECGSIMAINENRTINYVGFAGHTAFQSADKIGDKKLIKINYEKFKNGAKNYFCDKGKIL